MVGRSHSKALVMILFGGLLGYAAASEKLDPFQQPSATALAAGTSASQTCEITVASVAKVGDRDDASANELLALANHNELVRQQASQSGTKPNILVIWGDDIGISNISAYSDGLMGYTTPNIDRVAKEGVRFLHSRWPYL